MENEWTWMVRTGFTWLLMDGAAGYDLCGCNHDSHVLIYDPMLKFHVVQLHPKCVWKLSNTMIGWRFMPFGTLKWDALSRFYTNNRWIFCIPHSETLACTEQTPETRVSCQHFPVFPPSPPCCRPGCRRWTEIRRRVSWSSPCAPSRCAPGPWWRTARRSPAARAWCGGSPAGRSCSRSPADHWTSWPHCPRDFWMGRNGPRFCGKNSGENWGGAWGGAEICKSLSDICCGQLMSWNYSIPFPCNYHSSGLWQEWLMVLDPNHTWAVLGLTWLRHSGDFRLQIGIIFRSLAWEDSCLIWFRLWNQMVSCFETYLPC